MLDVCIFVCIFLCISVCGVCLDICDVFVFVWCVSVFVCMFVFIFNFVCVCMYLCLGICVYVWLCVWCLCSYVCICVYFVYVLVCEIESVVCDVCVWCVSSGTCYISCLLVSGQVSGYGSIYHAYQNWAYGNSTAMCFDLMSHLNISQVHVKNLYKIIVGMENQCKYTVLCDCSSNLQEVTQIYYWKTLGQL